MREWAVRMWWLSARICRRKAGGRGGVGRGLVEVGVAVRGQRRRWWRSTAKREGGADENLEKGGEGGGIGGGEGGGGRGGERRGGCDGEEENQVDDDDGDCDDSDDDDGDCEGKIVFSYVSSVPLEGVSNRSKFKGIF